MAGAARRPRHGWERWSREPWSVAPKSDDDPGFKIMSPDTNPFQGKDWVAQCFDEAGRDSGGNASRIVACVNALAGIRNPAAVTALIEACRTLNMWVDWEPKNEKDEQTKFDAMIDWRKTISELATEMKP